MPGTWRHIRFSDIELYETPCRGSRNQLNSQALKIYLKLFRVPSDFHPWSDSCFLSLQVLSKQVGRITRFSLGGSMAKVQKEIELSAEELAFEMIELTCDEMDSLTKALNMITNLCEELNQEIADESDEDLIGDEQVH